MADILHDTYDILKKIGSGSGGVVYLAQHKRLNKLVVIKEDKRRISVAPGAVSREMNILKNLSHTYIPHLYDFLLDEENDRAYTVMDYVEGESLNNPIKRGEQFSQAEVIAWAYQLLEALDYLHTRKPHGYVHGDVKPSNIMLTPDGDIRLIDFNISLALGGDNAVVGYTEGYASPEHYHSHYEDPKTELFSKDGESLDPSIGNASSISDGAVSSGPFEKPLDARSDIYSVGATLYHLLSGHRPAKNAEDVIPLKSDIASPALIAVIQKAMSPNPADRYQTAKEMLRALEEVRSQDMYAVLYRRFRILAAALVALIVLAGGAMTFIGLRQMETQRKWEVLARDSAAALQNGDVDTAVFDALAALPDSREAFAPPHTPQARRALTNALGVYDLTEGYKAHKRIPLPSEPVRTCLSPDGSRAAILVESSFLIYDTESGLQVTEPLAAEASVLSHMAFLDNDTLIYAGDEALTAYDLQQGQIAWTGRKAATQIALSANGRIAAAVYKDDNLATVYNARTGETVRVISFNDRRPNVQTGNLFLSDPGGYLFSMDAAGEWLAVSFQGGGLSLFNLSDPQRNAILLDVSPYERFEGGFSGSFFAWSGAGEQGSVFSVFNLESMETMGRVESGAPFHLQADESGILVSNLQADGDGLHAYAENTLTRLHPVSWTGTETVRIDGSIAAFVHTEDRLLLVTGDQRCLVYGADGRMITEYKSDARIDFADLAGDYLLTANTDASALRLQRYERNIAAQLFSYDPAFSHSDARVTPDGSTAMLFRYDRLRLLSRTGEILADVEIPDSGSVYSEYYWKDRDVLEVRYQDGLLRTYSTRNGTLLEEKPGEAPDGSNSGTYVTDDFVVDTPFRGTATVYGRDGDVVGALETDGTLYDSIQTGDYLVTLFRTADGERYGLLLEDGETIADLPYLSDVLPNGTLIFDDPKGGLYQSRIYSLEELLTMAN